MEKLWLQRGVWLALGLAAAWLAGKIIVPLLLPFALGTVLALAAQPARRYVQRLTALSYGPACAVGLSLTLAGLGVALWLLGLLAARQLGAAAQAAPQIGQTLLQSASQLQDRLLDTLQNVPEPVRPALQKAVLESFSDGSALIRQIADRIPGAVATTVGTVSGWALTLGTGILSAYMIALRLPRLRRFAAEHLPEKWSRQTVPALRNMKKALTGYGKAQLKLMGLTFGILTVGFLLMKIPYALLWAGLIALVDAVPVLGTGTVLLPWALLELAQGAPVRALSLTLLYGAAWLCRTVLEPRLVGRQIGLDPLWTLVAFYGGYRLWGLPGMILAPMAAAVCKGAWDSGVHK